MPVLWRFLHWIDQVNQSKGFKIGLSELAFVYDLQTFGCCRFLLKVKNQNTQLLLKSKQNDGAWKKRFFFIRRDSIPGGDKLPLNWVKSVERFEDLAPAAKDTKEKIEGFLALPAIDRTFKIEQISLQEASSSTPVMSTGSKVTRASARFALSDIDEAVTSGKLMVKKEKNSSLPPKKPMVDLTVKSSSAKKRKSSEIRDLDLDNMDLGDIFTRLTSFSQALYDRASKSAEALKLHAEAERIFKEKELALKVANRDLEERLEQEKASKEALEKVHAEELNDVIAEVKESAAKAILEARIQLAEDVENAGSWDLAGWRAALAKFTGEHVNSSKDPASEKKVGGTGGDEDQIPKV